MIVDNQNKPSNDLGFYVKLDKLRSVYQWVRILIDNIFISKKIFNHYKKLIIQNITCLLSKISGCTT